MIRKQVHASPRRGATVLFLVAILVTLAAIGLAATVSMRSQATRQISHIGTALDQISLAKEALHEVSSQTHLNKLLREPAAAEALRSAIQAGVLQTGIVTTEGPALRVLSPLATEAALKRGFVVSPVRIRLLEFEPGTSRGRMRFTVTVGSNRQYGPKERTYSHDFPVRAYQPGPPHPVAFEINEVPEWRIYP